MFARRAKAILDPPAMDRGHNVAARILQVARKEPHVRGVASAESDDARHAKTPRMSGQTLVVAIVAIEHRDRIGLHAGEQAGFLVGDRLFRAHVTDMRRLDVGDHADMGLDQPGQRLDLAGMVHADLEHAVPRVARQAREADRHADVVVVAGDAGRGRRLCRQQGTQSVLGAGLADGAGDAGDARRAAAAAGVSQIGQGLHRVGDTDQRPLRPRNVARHDGGRGAAHEGVGDVDVTVGGLAVQREEQVALADGAAVESDAGCFERRGRCHR